MSDAIDTKLDMHIKEDDKRFGEQGRINSDLYRRIDSMNTKLWLIMVGVATVALEAVLPHIFA